MFFKLITYILNVTAYGFVYKNIVSFYNHA